MADVAIPGKVDVVAVPFHGDEILTVEVNGKPHVILKPALDRLGLDYWAQIQKLRNRSWAALASRQVQVPGQAQRREMLTCDARTFAMLLATVDENRVAKDVRDKLIAYQRECADVIEAYWTNGGVINPREKPMSPAEMLLHHAQIAVDHERKIERLGVQVTELGARMDGIEQRTGWRTALAFAKLNKLPSDHNSVLRLGKRAAAIARRDHIELVKAPNDQFGEVNMYPEAVLREAAGLVTA